MQVNEAAEVIYDLVDAQANLIFGAVVDPAMKNGEVPLIPNPYKYSPRCDTVLHSGA